MKTLCHSHAQATLLCGALFLFSLPGLAQIRAGTPHADPDALEHRYLVNLRQLTHEGERSGEAYFSPDGSQLSFQAVQDGCPHYQIYTLALTERGATPRLVSPGQGKTTCSFFHPKQPRIMFASTHLDPATHAADAEDRSPRQGYTWDLADSMDIFESDFDGKNIVRLTDGTGYDAECGYSPDGSRIVFTSTASGNPEIWIMNADGTERRQLTDSPAYDGGPFFGPDGKRVTYRRMEADGSCQVHVVDADGKNDKPLTTGDAVSWAPFWHPDGKHLVYTANVGKMHNFELFVMRDDGTGVTRLTYSAGADVLPSFSADGKRLAWTSTRVGGKSQVFVADVYLPVDAELGSDAASLGMEAPDQEDYSKKFPSRHRK